MSLQSKAFGFSLFVWAVASTALPALAKELPVIGSLGIVGADNREALDVQTSNWSALGQINVTGIYKHRRCTGVKVGPGLVLTDAACVFDARHKRTFPADTIHFIAGVNRNNFVGHAVARCIHLPTHFDKEAELPVNADLRRLFPSQKFLQQDLALIVLAEDIPQAATMLLAKSKPAMGTKLVHASYAREKRWQLMADKTCKVTGTIDDVLKTDCDSGAGGAGGPLLVEEAGQLKIAAIMAVTQRETETLAVPLSIWPDMLRETSCP